MDSPTLGLGHYAHPWLGREVLDTATGRVGILRAIAPDPDPRAAASFVPVVGAGAPVAWLVPVGGGVEWTTERTALQVGGRPCSG